MNVLVDTSVWSLAFRRKPADLRKAEEATVRELVELIDEGRACIMGFIRQELLSGIKSDEQFEKLRAKLSAFRDTPMSTEDFETAAKASNDCSKKGVASSTVDMLFVAIALRRNWEIFTTDPDFERFAKILPIQLHHLRNEPA